eukprot:1188967-Prorocentrum_minimum.AAC.2
MGRLCRRRWRRLVVWLGVVVASLVLYAAAPLYVFLCGNTPGGTRDWHVCGRRCSHLGQREGGDLGQRGDILDGAVLQFEAVTFLHGGVRDGRGLQRGLLHADGQLRAAHVPDDPLREQRSTVYQ